MKYRIESTVSYIGSMASIFSLVAFYENVIALYFTIIFICGMFGLWVHATFVLGKSRIVCQEESEIDLEMKKIVKSEGRIDILTRDFSWAQRDPSTWRELINKSKKNELRIFMQHETDSSQELSKHGAKIQYYNNIKFEPKSRFTIFHSGRPHAKLAIGYRNAQGRHVIEYHEGSAESPIHIANDLLDLLGQTSHA